MYTLDLTVNLIKVMWWCGVKGGYVRGLNGRTLALFTNLEVWRKMFRLCPVVIESFFALLTQLNTDHFELSWIELNWIGICQEGLI